MKLSGHMRVKGAPPGPVESLCAGCECSEARLVAPGADLQLDVPTEDPAEYVTDARLVLPIDLDCNRN